MHSLRLQTRSSFKIFQSVFNVRTAICIKLNSKLHQEATKTWNDIPGPSSLPLIGPLLHFLPGIGSIGNKLGYPLSEQIYKSYGPIVRLDAMLGKPALLMLFHPESIEQVLRSESVYPLRPGFESMEYFRKVYTKPKPEFTGLITDHGEAWKSVRSKVNPVMLQPKTVKMYTTVLTEVAQDMVKRMKSLRNDKDMIPGELDIELNRWALESIGVVALGGRLGCLEDDLPEDSPEHELIKVVHKIFDYVQELDFQPSMWRYYSTRKYKEAMRTYQRQVDLSEMFIKRAVKNFEDIKDSNKEKSILEKLLEINEQVAIAMACDMLLAGVDTAANTLLAAMYLLARNPEKQAKLREELIQNEDQKYLKAALKESMRMMPVVSGNLRKTTKDYDILGYCIPKDTMIVFSHQYLSMMEEQFPRAQEYLPERWLVSKEDPLHHGNAHPFAMMPFGFGARQCIGKRIAELEIEIFLAKLVQSFNIGWDGEPVNITSTSLNYVKGPYNFTFKDV